MGFFLRGAQNWYNIIAFPPYSFRKLLLHNYLNVRYADWQVIVVDKN